MAARKTAFVDELRTALYDEAGLHRNADGKILDKAGHFAKTERIPCVYWAMHKCSNGDKCAFNHDYPDPKYVKPDFFKPKSSR